MTAPDVGVGDDIAHYYFGQLVNGMVRCWPSLSWFAGEPAMTAVSDAGTT